MASLGDMEHPSHFKAWFFLSSFLFLAVLLCALYLRTGPEVPEYRLHHGVFLGMCPEDHRVWLLGTSWDVSSSHLSPQPLWEGGWVPLLKHGSCAYPPIGGLLSTASKLPWRQGDGGLGERTEDRRASHSSSHQLWSCLIPSMVEG